MRISVAISTLVLLAGCQDQRVVVLDQSQAASARAPTVVALPTPPRPVPSPCSAPAGTGPFEHVPTALQGGKFTMPPRAVSEHVAGCAGIRFRIGPDGAPTNIVVMAEYPLGYGFGDAARAVVAHTRWPARDDLAWHYLVANMHPPNPS